MIQNHLQTETTLNRPSSEIPSALSPWRGWFYLVGFSLRQLGRVRQLVGIAAGLLLLSSLVVSLITMQFGWNRTAERVISRNMAAAEWIAGGMVEPAIADSPFIQNIRKENRPLAVFSRWIIFFLFLGFLLPLWTLSFATSALGSDRENRSLIWLLTRPLPRGSIYLAKWLAILPWALGFNLGGFWILTRCGGETGRAAFNLFWPAVIAGTIAFSSIFHLIAALFPRPAIFGLLYAFFFETILSELPVPGTLKRLSVNYYVRCLMYHPAESQGIPTESRALFVPVSEPLAWILLLGGSALLIVFGMWQFSRSEFRDES